MSNSLLEFPEFEIQLELRRDGLDTARGIGGGLLVYTKCGVKILSIGKGSEMEQYCGFRMADAASDVTFTLVYRSPNSSPEMMDSLSEVTRKTDKCSIIVGDFNLPSIDWERRSAAGARPTQFLEACEEANLDQLITFPTQVRGNTLDLLITNIPDRVTEVKDIGRLGRSDHSMILFGVSFASKPAKTTEQLPSWSRADWPSIKGALAGFKWPEILGRCTTSEAWEKFRDTITELVNVHVPTRPRRSPNKPVWINREVVRAVRKKRRLWKRARCGLEEMAKYREAEREATRKIGNAK